MTDYLTMAEVVAIHVDQIERYGGSHDVRDAGLLESALFRPRRPATTPILSRKPRPFGRASPKTIP
jgi:prophage maintenance system killer protein